jgi:hypothetical protein
LAENGVPRQEFKELLNDGLQETIQQLTTWEGSNAMRNLWIFLARFGAVKAQRQARENPGQARAQGLSELDPDADDLDEQDEDEDGDGSIGVDKIGSRSIAWWDDYISGQPSSLEATAMYLIDSGFTPQTLPVLRSKLEKITESAIRRFVERYKLTVPQSCSGFMIPGTFSLLCSSVDSALRLRSFRGFGSRTSSNSFF